MPSPRKKLHVAVTCCAAAAVAFMLDSCSSSPKIAGIPDKLPDIQLAGNTATPSHSMAKYEYPFDEKGRYMSDWAAQGESRSGQSAAATTSDVSTWGESHGGAATGRGRVVVKNKKPSSSSDSSRKSTASSSKSKPKSGSTPPKPTVVTTTTKPKPSSQASSTSEPKVAASKPAATAKAKPAASKGGRSYTVKKGDTLGAIAGRFSSSVAKIKAANGMSSDFLSIGKVLRIP